MGHQFTKTSDSPVCPQCEQEKKPETGLLSLVAAPARRALQKAGIKRINDLSKFSEAEILNLHGMGPKAVAVIKAAMKKQKVNFKKST
jgi:predicted RecB family nuclease